MVWTDKGLLHHRRLALLLIPITDSLTRKKPHTFLEVLNRQDESTTYTMEVENENKELSYLEIMSKNPGTGKYEF